MIDKTDMAFNDAWNALHAARRDFDDLSLRVQEADERAKAVRTVLNALVFSLKKRGFDRKQFQQIVSLASADIPNSGPASAQHEVLLTEARKILGISPPKA